MSSEIPQHSPPASPERPASPQPDETNQSQSAAIAHSTASIDSETLLLDPSTATIEKEESPRPKPTRKDTDLKQCWICYADETEDSPNTSRWRSPCACSLVAHESCLLDWVADLETPASRRSKTTAPKIQCPQCKKDIKVARPKSLVVEVTKATERLGSRLVIPGIIAVLGGGVYTGATMHGISSVFLVFGREDFHGLIRDPTLSAKWLITFPFIPVLLILSRTNLGDQILPTLPLLVYATRLPQSWISGMDHAQFWPPSPELAFSSLPFIRSVYKRFVRTLLAGKEAQWEKAVQPRAGAAGDADAAAAAENVLQENEAGIDIFNFEVEIVDGDEANIAADGQAAQAEPEIPAVDEAPGNQAGAGAQNNNNANQPRARQQPRGLTITGTYLADLVMGALALPAVASVMGELLKLGLPTSWTTPPQQLMFKLGGAPSFRVTSKPGFLHHKWARSIVGGCLFIVMKDTLLLYSKYRIAKDHQKRRICNWDKTLGRFVDDDGS
ncbi:MAG: hypothetical protein GOMPHAMPRED_002352 [Gomphillus americanus]|uniref:RING-CH-type domain-containing protein n=1 Tax=Gomphillus americanus TaxID=1940652 RepID=A0A8H3F912_9LECA|nr:MAG: hypothetical protein GOMPHAMPRED_002352 [Gomphillus americanus]